MLQRYHLLLRRPHGDRVFADSRSFGWLLPIVTADARERAPHVVSRFIERLNIQGTVACITSGIVDRHTAGIDWLALADEGNGGSGTSLRETTVDTLLESPALLPVQSDLLRAYQQLSRITHSTSSPGWLTEAARWAAGFFSHSARGLPISAIPHRAELFEATWEFSDRTTSFFLKWRGQGRPFLEPRLARILGKYGGACIPATIAYDEANGRWLTARVRGAPLTAHLSPEAAGRVARAMARMQMDLVSADWRLRSIGALEESLAELADEGDRILDRLPSQPDHPEVRVARAAIHHACAELDALRFPATWIHTDFAPENTFIDDDDGVYFIDFEEPWIGPAPVAMEFLYAGFRRHVADTPARSAVALSACESFVRAWQALVPASVMRQAFASTRLVAEVLRISRRLRALVAKEKTGELVGFVEPAIRESARRLVALANSDLTKSAARWASS